MEDHSVEFVCGGAAAFINVLVVFPLHKSIFIQQLHGVSWPDAVNLLKRDGLALLFRGVLPPLMQRSCSGALMFGGQSFSENLLHKNSTFSQLQKKTLSGVYAAFLESALTPFERVQTILQTSQYNKVYQNTFRATLSLYNSHGIKELYRGFTPVLYRSCFGNALYFSGRQVTKDVAPESLLYYERRVHDFVSGSLLGACVSAATFPMNVVKARIQSQIGVPYASVTRTIIALVSEEKGNILRLYRGVPANFLRSLISWGIITMSYEWLLEHFGESSNEFPVPPP
ncbi:hypothetical protein Ciccas_009712 [Cichlidogyrus casuarinus]|uniref:Mitochondrial carrier protein n=1 Tax=Cichlidogyrus casuarinus TaxID=1844966 RepID=A0ABD2PWB1_9PLAT